MSFEKSTRCESLASASCRTFVKHGESFQSYLTLLGNFVKFSFPLNRALKFIHCWKVNCPGNYNIEMIQFYVWPFYNIMHERVKVHVNL